MASASRPACPARQLFICRGGPWWQCLRAISLLCAFLSGYTTADSEPSTFEAAAEEDSGVAPNVSLVMLQWNPHWQCAAWDQNNCSNHVRELVDSWLVEHDIDFANIIELGAEPYDPPKGWGKLRANCSHDDTTLIYNQDRWTPVEGDARLASEGCMALHDRPFVLQTFQESSGLLIGSNASNASSKVVVVGAHFPHPPLLYMPLLEQNIVELRTAIAAAVNASDQGRVILIADTNEGNPIPSTSIREYLQLPGLKTVSTDLEFTCCYDIDFGMGATFDRIISNFGGHMETQLMMSSELPLWARQEKYGRRAAFHLPILGRLLAGSAGPSPGPGFLPQHRLAKRIFLICVAVAVVLLVLWFFFAAAAEKRNKRKSKILVDEETAELAEGSGETTSDDSS
mmetsp:Transcript_78983/g.164056  ORF Transcript_78983/g.164056 Transcript_78983/m.164056 type:complete len:399 (-) Transcript_78983:344-1540(-)